MQFALISNLLFVLYSCFQATLCGKKAIFNNIHIHRACLVLMGKRLNVWASPDGRIFLRYTPAFPQSICSEPVWTQFLFCSRKHFAHRLISIISYLEFITLTHVWCTSISLSLKLANVLFSGSNPSLEGELFSHYFPLFFLNGSTRNIDVFCLFVLLFFSQCVNV